MYVCSIYNFLKENNIFTTKNISLPKLLIISTIFQSPYRYQWQHQSTISYEDPLPHLKLVGELKSASEKLYLKKKSKSSWNTKNCKLKKVREIKNTYLLILPWVELTTSGSINWGFFFNHLDSVLKDLAEMFHKSGLSVLCNPLYAIPQRTCTATILLWWLADSEGGKTYTNLALCLKQLALSVLKTNEGLLKLMSLMWLIKPDSLPPPT